MNIVRQALIKEAAEHGYTREYADMRCGLFFLRKGTEVLSGGRFGRFHAEHAKYYVSVTVRHGRRIDQVKGSLYYVEQGASA